eukprot:gene7060-9636_t
MSIFQFNVDAIEGGLFEEFGLEILAFPCNNFGGQEPGSNEEIMQFAASKGASFRILGKLDCENGSETHPIYVFLKEAMKDSVLGNSLKWNFAKFLCNSDGVPIKAYSHRTAPLAIEEDIQAILND